MILPVATLLAFIASDMCHERDQRERATALLRTLDTKFCAAIGLSADWGIICQWFLRLFDVASHDIAKSRAEVDCMVETLDAVFLQGGVFKKMFAAVSDATRRVSAADEEPLPPVHVAVCETGVGTPEVGFITA